MQNQLQLVTTSHSEDDVSTDPHSALAKELDRREANNSLAMQELCIRIARLRRSISRRSVPAEISADIVMHQRRAA